MSHCGLKPGSLFFYIKEIVEGEVGVEGVCVWNLNAAVLGGLIELLCPVLLVLPSAND